MKKAVFDTNILIKFFHTPGPFADLLNHYDLILLPSVVLAEFKSGLFNTEAGEKGRLALSRIIASPGIRIVPMTEVTSDNYAKIFQILKKVGCPIPQNDIWIAASTIEHEAELVTFDDHFKSIPDLRVIYCK